MDTEYECAACGGVFERSRPDGEAMAEARKLWAADDLMDAAIVCDDCWRAMGCADALRAVESIGLILRDAASYVARIIKRDARRHRSRFHRKRPRIGT